MLHHKTRTLALSCRHAISFVGQLVTIVLRCYTGTNRLESVLEKQLKHKLAISSILTNKSTSLQG